MLPPDVDALVRAAREGRPGALDQLLTVIRPEVMRLCARFLPFREDAEEAAQDVLLAVARGLDGFEGRAAFGTWLHRVAANRSRSTYRALRRRAAETGIELEGRPDPRTTSVIAGLRLDLLDGLEALGPDLAEPVALRDVLGLAYGDIAALLDLPEGTVKSRIHEGRRRLRARLGG